MESGRLLEWRVSEGDKLNPQDVIAEVETDKAAMEIEVFDPAVVLKLLRNAGDMVEVDTPIAILGQSDSEDFSALLAEFESGKSTAKEEAPAPKAPAKADKRRAGPAARAAEIWAYRSMMSKGLAPVDGSPARTSKPLRLKANRPKPLKVPVSRSRKWDNRPLHDPSWNPLCRLCLTSLIQSVEAKPTAWPSQKVAQSRYRTQ